MKLRTAVVTGITGLMLNMGLGSALFAQPAYRYREDQTARRYAANGDWQAQQAVRQAYRDILRREPDAAGLQGYTDAMVRRGWSIAEVRQSLATSPEYAQRFGRTSYRGYRSNRY